MKREMFIQYTTLGANLGVIAGIILLAYELNQNSQQLDAQASITHMMFRVNVNERWADDADLMSLRIKASHNEQLTPLEEARLKFDAQSVFAYWEWQVVNLQDEVNDQLLINAIKITMSQYPYFQKAWQANKNYHPKFMAFVEENVISQLE